jgi:hypothetical protein
MAQHGQFTCAAGGFQMKTGRLCGWIFITGSLLIAASCSRPFTAVAPGGFATYKGGDSFRSVSPDHVVYRVRTCRNKPYADFGFWREALPERMKNAGYRIIGDSVIVINNQNALLLEMAAPLGDADFSYIVLMSVGKKRILLAEAAGLFTELQRRKPEIIAALHKAALE